ncbi:MAG: hypothetical protein Q3999_03425 [Buchananella hordeovulneris]|nr:hypothetical protein [Buchananella hordeovulneris]
MVGKRGRGTRINPQDVSPGKRELRFRLPAELPREQNVRIVAGSRARAEFRAEQEALLAAEEAAAGTPSSPGLGQGAERLRELLAARQAEAKREQELRREIPPHW